jgi:hypothetical protein
MEKLIKMIEDPKIRMIIHECIVTKPITLADPSFPIMLNLMQTLKDTFNEVKK